MLYEIKEWCHYQITGLGLWLVKTFNRRKDRNLAAHLYDMVRDYSCHDLPELSEIETDDYLSVDKILELYGRPRRG